MKIDLIALNCRYSHSCLALFYIRGELEKNLSFSPQICQYTINDPYYDTLLHITGSDAQALFFSVYIWNADYIKRLVEDINKAAPETIIVLGGPQAPALAESIATPHTLVLGEIEGVDPSFYSDLLEKKLNSFYKCTPVASFDFPYKEEDFSGELKNRNIYFESSRGCPFFCSYCLSSISRGVRSKELSTVKEELRTLFKYTPKVVRFVDRTFNADPERAIELWSFLLKESPRNTKYHFEIAPDIFTKEMFSFLETVPEGFFQFEVGVQSTNEATLQAINRKMDIEKSFASIKRLLSLDTIHIHIDLILGLPHDCQKSFLESFHQVFTLHPHYIQMGLLKVLPDTSIRSSCRDYSLEFCSNPPYQVLSTQWLKHAELRKLYLLGECIERFYNNRFFKHFFRFITINNIDPVSFFIGLLEFCISSNFFKRAKTQVFLFELLFGFVVSFKDSKILQELLIYDWLSCGHRFLPEMVGGDLNAIRNNLFKSLPDSLEGVYDKQSRKVFFKKSVFWSFSAKVANFTDASLNAHKRGFIAFLPEVGCGVIKKNKSLFLGYF